MNEIKTVKPKYLHEKFQLRKEDLNAGQWKDYLEKSLRGNTCNIINCLRTLQRLSPAWV